MNEPEDLSQVTGSMDPQDQNQAGGAFTDTGARHDEPDARSTNLEDGTSFSIAVDAQASAFVATKDGVEFGAVPFADKNGRVTLLATSILPDYRGQGLATELTRRVLDSIRALMLIRSYRVRGGLCFVRQQAGDRLAAWARPRGIQLASR